MLIGFNAYKTKILKLGISSSFELANYLLENYNFAMLPGVDFGFDKEDLFFRIAFVDFNGQKIMKTYQTNKNIDAAFIKQNAPNVIAGIKKIKSFISDVNN